MLRDGGHLWPREGTLRRSKRDFQNELATPHAQRIDSTGHRSCDRIFLSFSSEAFCWLPSDASSTGASARNHRKQLCNQHQTYQNNCRQCLKTKRGRSYFEYLRPLLRLTINHGSVLGKVDISLASPTLPITSLFWELIFLPD